MDSFALVCTSVPVSDSKCTQLGNWESSRAGHVPLGEVAPLATSAVTPRVDEDEACASQYDTLPTTTSTLYSDLMCGCVAASQHDAMGGSARKHARR